MTALKQVMKARNIKYFSQLTPKQKDASNWFYLCAKLNILNLDKGLQKAIVMGMDIEEVFAIKDQLRGEKMFYYEPLKVYISLKLNELLKTN